MPLDFTAIDFETANSSSASACSVGLVKVRGGRVVDRAGWFIRPPFGYDYFTAWNTRIHGIVETDVADAPTWSEQLPDLVAYADGDPLVAHNAGFDMGVIRGACTASLVDVPPFSYLCSLVVARRTYHLDSYRLPVVAMAAGFEDFAHHDAMADAEACAAIVIHAAKRHDADDLAHLAKITGARLRSIGVEAMTLSRPMALSGTALSDAGVSGTALSDAALSGTALSGTGVSGTALSDAAVSGTALSDAAVSGTALSDAGVSGTALSDAALSDAALSDLIRRSGAMGSAECAPRSRARRGRIG